MQRVKQLFCINSTLEKYYRVYQQLVPMSKRFSIRISRYSTDSISIEMVMLNRNHFEFIPPDFDRGSIHRYDKLML
ncbi:hypothetical protein MKW98_015494 [Papaver atlanticum]|uniref:Uncharacterized protein n=1 Tax=Papaver atlanticum TaxID=357466 RepID=A0AAD4RYY9_9MAGN|nr:hypothetical protein MKW98_015494 [Papaver atlanticum]